MLNKKTKELAKEIEEILLSVNDYESAANAITDVAYKAFGYAARDVQASGFQAEWAVMQLFKKIKNLDHGFRVIDYSKLLYPQYKDHFSLSFYECVNENKAWLREEARKLLLEDDENGMIANPSVREHWKYLSELS